MSCGPLGRAAGCSRTRRTQPRRLAPCAHKQQQQPSARTEQHRELTWHTWHANTHQRHAKACHIQHTQHATHNHKHTHRTQHTNSNAAHAACSLARTCSWTTSARSAAVPAGVDGRAAPHRPRCQTPRTDERERADSVGGTRGGAAGRRGSRADLVLDLPHAARWLVRALATPGGLPASGRDGQQVATECSFGIYLRRPQAPQPCYAYVTRCPYLVSGSTCVRESPWARTAICCRAVLASRRVCHPGPLESCPGHGACATPPSQFLVPKSCATSCIILAVHKRRISLIFRIFCACVQQVRYELRLGKTKLGTLCAKIRKQIKGPVLKAFRYGMKLIELYSVTKSF